MKLAIYTIVMTAHLSSGNDSKPVDQVQGMQVGVKIDNGPEL